MTGSKSVRVLKWIGIVAGSLVVLLVVGVAVLLMVFDWNWLKSPAVARITDATGRKIEIRGDIKGEYSLTPTVELNDVHIANADWSKDPEMLSVGKLRVTIALKELLRGRVVIPEIYIADTHALLEKNAKGQENWKFGATPAGAVKEAAKPDERSEMPVVGRLSIENSTFQYRDATRELDMKSKISTVLGQGQSGRDLRIEGNGTLQAMPFRLAIVAGSIDQLRESKEPYPLDVRASVGDTKVSIKGTVMDPLQPNDVIADLSIEGKNLADLYALAKLPLPPSPPYALSGKIDRRGQKVMVKNLKGRIGESDIAGNATIDISRDRPVMEGEFVSNVLDFKDLATFTGVTPAGDQAPSAKTGPSKEGPKKDAAGTKATPPNAKAAAAEKEKEKKKITPAAQSAQRSEKVLPNDPIEVARLRSADMKVKFEGKSIRAPNFVPIDNLKTQVNLQNGLLKVEPLSFGVAEGAIQGRATLDARKDVPSVDVDLTIRGLGLKEFFKNTDMMDLTSGKIGGKIELRSQGSSMAQLLGNGNGRLTAAMTGGSLNPLIIEAIGLDIAEALAVLLTPKVTSVPIRCMVSDLVLKDGLATVQGLALDTADSTIWGQGSIDFKNEHLNLRLHADPKDVSVLSANAPIAITGTFGDPSIQVDPARTAGKGGVIELLGRVVNPIIALLPFVDLGLGQDTDCRQFDQATSKPIPEPKAKKQ